jgi:hypothetical protein
VALGISSAGRLGISWPRTPLWARLIQDAEAAAAAAGASLWYAPPDSYAPRAINGPFVGADGSGGPSALGSGPVGWFRDAAGGPLGPELLQNAGFASGLAFWGLTDATGTVSAGRATVTPTAAGGRIEQLMPTVVGRQYTLRATVRGNGVAFCGIRALRSDNFTGPNDLIASAVDSPRVIQFTAAHTGYWISAINTSSAAPFEVTGFTLREMPGNHATQPTSANRPIFVAAPGAAAAAAGFGALSFDTSDDRLWTASLPANTAEAAIVGVTIRNNGYYELVSKSSGNAGFFIRQDALTRFQIVTGNGATLLFVNVPGVTPAIGQHYVVAIFSDGRVFVDGVQRTTAKVGYASATGVFAMGNNLAALPGADLTGAAYLPAGATDAQMHTVGKMLAYIGGSTYTG